MGYKKYIKDYRKEYIVKPNGKPGVTATYIGKYFGFVANGEELGKTRLVFSILSALALVCCIVPLLFNTESAHNLYVSVPQVTALFPIAHLAMGVANLYLKKPPLIREFRDKTEGRIISNSIASGIALAVAAAARIVYCIINTFGTLDIVSALLLALGSASAFYIFIKRRLVATEELENGGEE